MCSAGSSTLGSAVLAKLAQCQEAKGPGCHQPEHLEAGWEGRGQAGGPCASRAPTWLPLLCTGGGFPCSDDRSAGEDRTSSSCFGISCSPVF